MVDAEESRVSKCIEIGSALASRSGVSFGTYARVGPFSTRLHRWIAHVRESRSNRIPASESETADTNL